MIMATTTTIAMLLSILLYLLIFTYATTSPYTPSDYILLDCGSPSNSTSLDHRQWQTDTASNSFTKSQTSKASKQPPSVPQVPYMTARIFLSEFTYFFPSLSPGPKFLRLYFFPATYIESLNQTESFFSVKANQNTLLSNFSAFLTVSSIRPSSLTLIKEYIVHVNDTHQQLNMTFLPNPDSYAFINGIDIVSIPEDLYFRGDKVSLGTPSGNPYFLKNDKALETLFRLNVGGGFVPPIEDSGMYRTWSPDEDFVLGASLNPTRNFDVKYTKFDPEYTAPEIIYTTARTMDENYSRSYNMTWVFPVDSGFYYLLRLHFCEFFLEITKQGQRIFSLFINNQTLQLEADVLSWVGYETAVSRDYVVYVGGSDGKIGEQQMYLKMKPVSLDTHSAHDNALLNGLEMFKISKSDGSLNSPNPEAPAVSISPSGQPNETRSLFHESKKSIPWELIVGVAGGVSLVVVAFLIFLRRRRVKSSATLDDDDKEKSYWVLLTNKSRATKTSVTSDGSLLPSALCRHFSLQEITRATGNFDDNFMIGVGGFGNVYKGYVDNGATEVAIKRLNPSSKQGKIEFLTEIGFLSKLRHLHVVSLIGYCDESGEMILVYDYMSRGTLRDHLYNSSDPSLPWKQRLQICIGAAKGLNYLHTGAKYSIIHRDVKSTNILLDEKWVAKVSDFGLSKVGPMGGDETHVSTMVKGSVGYLDPEYYKRQQLTEKSDVYSFGVVLFEVLCSRPAIKQSVPKEQVNLVNWVRWCNKNDTIFNILDPELKDEIAVESLNKYVEIGLRCFKDKGIERPAMSDVVWSLEFALELQVAAEKRMICINVKEDDKTSALLGLHGGRSTTDVDDSNDIFSMSMEPSSTSYSKSKSSGDFTASDDGFKSQSAVFSEIINPSVR